MVSGALSAFALILRLFTGPGDRVVIDAPPIRWPSAPFRAPPAAPSGCASAAGMGLRWTGGDYCADCAAAGVADAGFSQPHWTLYGCPTRQRVADIAARTRTTLVIDETMADLWYNARRRPRRWPASIPMPRCSPLVRPESYWGTTYRLDPRQRADHRLAYSGPRFAGFGYAAAGATGLQLATGKCRHTAAAAAGICSGAPGHVRNADGGIFSPLAVFATGRWALFWVELPDMLATLFSARAESQGIHIGTGTRFGLEGRSIAIYVCRLRCRMKHCAGPSPRYNRCGKALLNRRKIHVCEK